MPVLSTLGAAIANVYGFTSGLIKDQYFNLVSLLLPGNGTNGAQNNTFLDSGTANSGSGFTITRNGNTTQGTFSPFSQTGWGAYFDGSNDNVSASSSTDLAAGSGAFTVEAWVFTADTKFMICASQTVGGLGFGYNIDNGTQGLWLGRVGTGVDATSGAQLTYNQWNHVAVTRDGSNNVKFFVNGTQVGSTTTVSTNYGTTAQGLYIGADQDGASNPFAGYISNLRYIKGQSILGTATSFTVPTSPLTSTTVGWSGTGVASSITGTVSLLTCQSNRFVDNSTTPKTLTPNNGTAITPFAPFAPTQSYSASAVGGSGYFDGTGDYLVSPTNAAFGFATGDFTVQCWFYLTAAITGNAKGIFQVASAVNGTVTGYGIGIKNTQTIQYYAGATFNDSSTAITTNQWYHLTMTRSSGTVYVYLNGTLIQNGSKADTQNITSGETTVGIWFDKASGFEFPGYISGFRVVKGSVISEVVPTAPPTAVSGTSLLLNFINAGVVDATAKNVLETVGNAQISTSVSKFGGGSVYFDGLNSYLLGASSQQYEFGSGDFTIEAWVNISAAPGDGGIITKGLTGTIDTKIWSLEFVGSGTYPNAAGWYVNAASASFIITGTTNLKTSTWTHVAVCKSGNNTRLFVNGTQEGSTYTTGYTIASGGSLYVGTSFYAPTTRDITGYMDDLRITKFARYTANFTAPTAPFPLQ